MKVIDVAGPRGIFIAAQKRPLDCEAIDIKCTSDGPGKEFEIQRV
jgi:hypothetical protein